MNDEVMPLGKYKGRSVAEIMATDPQYIEWLTLQNWFVEKYKPTYNFIVQAGPPSEMTPEHNALQAKFLDNDFCLEVAKRACPKLFEIDAKKYLSDPYQNLRRQNEERIKELQRDIESIKRHITTIDGYESHFQQKEPYIKTLAQKEAEISRMNKPDWRDPNKRYYLENEIRNLQYNIRRAEEYEVWFSEGRAQEEVKLAEKQAEVARLNAFDEELKARASEVKSQPVKATFSILNRAMELISDVMFDIYFSLEWIGPHINGCHPGYYDSRNYHNRRRFLIEVKPSIGDDYPAILRQMRDQRRRGLENDLIQILCYSEFAAKGATLEQVTAIFDEAGITLSKI